MENQRPEKKAENERHKVFSTKQFTTLEPDNSSTSVSEPDKNSPWKVFEHQNFQSGCKLVVHSQNSILNMFSLVLQLIEVFRWPKRQSTSLENKGSRVLAPGSATLTLALLTARRALLQFISLKIRRSANCMKLRNWFWSSKVVKGTVGQWARRLF